MLQSWPLPLTTRDTLFSPLEVGLTSAGVE